MRGVLQGDTHVTFYKSRSRIQGPGPEVSAPVVFLGAFGLESLRFMFYNKAARRPPGKRSTTMNYSRRDFGKLALASLPAAALLSKSGNLLAAAQMAGKPNSRYGGVQVGVITYSYRSMPDQSAEAILGYVVESGINAIELMGPPAEAYAMKRTGFTPLAGAGRGGGRGPGGGAAAATVVPPGSWNGQPCPAVRAPGAGGGGGRGRGELTRSKSQRPMHCASGNKVCRWTSTRT